MRGRLLLLAPVLALAFTAVAHADSITFSLTQNGCSGSCGTGPYGTIVITQTSATTATVTETLGSTEGFVGTGAGDGLEFNLLGVPTITISSLTSGFKVDTGSATASTFGSFDYGVTCDYSGGACNSGASSMYTGVLSFTITDSAGIALSDFVGNSKGYFLASDIMGTSGKTGNVAALTGSAATVTPEPSSLALFGTGFFGLAGLIRRRRTT